MLMSAITMGFELEWTTATSIVYDDAETVLHISWAVGEDGCEKGQDSF
jgi:hypothetical protein